MSNAPAVSMATNFLKKKHMRVRIFTEYSTCTTPPALRQRSLDFLLDLVGHGLPCMIWNIPGYLGTVVYTDIRTYHIPQPAAVETDSQKFY